MHSSLELRLCCINALSTKSIEQARNSVLKELINKPILELPLKNDDLSHIFILASFISAFHPNIAHTLIRSHGIIAGTLMPHPLSALPIQTRAHSEHVVRVLRSVLIKERQQIKDYNFERVKNLFLLYKQSANRMKLIELLSTVSTLSNPLNFVSSVAVVVPDLYFLPFTSNKKIQTLYDEQFELKIIRAKNRIQMNLVIDQLKKVLFVRQQNIFHRQYLNMRVPHTVLIETICNQIPYYTNLPRRSIQFSPFKRTPIGLSFNLNKDQLTAASFLVQTKKQSVSSIVAGSPSRRYIKVIGFLASLFRKANSGKVLIVCAQINMDKWLDSLSTLTHQPHYHALTVLTSSTLNAEYMNVKNIQHVSLLEKRIKNYPQCVVISSFGDLQTSLCDNIQWSFVIVDEKNHLLAEDTLGLINQISFNNRALLLSDPNSICLLEKEYSDLSKVFCITRIWILARFLYPDILIDISPSEFLFGKIKRKIKMRSTENRLFLNTFVDYVRTCSLVQKSEQLLTDRIQSYFKRFDIAPSFSALQKYLLQRICFSRNFFSNEHYYVNLFRAVLDHPLLIQKKNWPFSFNNIKESGKLFCILRLLTIMKLLHRRGIAVCSSARLMKFVSHIVVFLKEECIVQNSEVLINFSEQWNTRECFLFIVGTDCEDIFQLENVSFVVFVDASWDEYYTLKIEQRIRNYFPFEKRTSDIPLFRIYTHRLIANESFCARAQNREANAMEALQQSFQMKDIDYEAVIRAVETNPSVSVEAIASLNRMEQKARKARRDEHDNTIPASVVEALSELDGEQSMVVESTQTIFVEKTTIKKWRAANKK